MPDRTSGIKKIIKKLEADIVGLFIFKAGCEESDRLHNRQGINSLFNKFYEGSDQEPYGR